MASSDYRAKYEAIIKEITDATGNSPQLIADLQKAIDEKTNYNKDLIEQKNALQQEQYSTPAQLRQAYYESAIRNPLEQENLIAGRLASTGTRLGTTVDLLNNRGQQRSDILNQFNALLNARQQARQTSAESMYRLYQDELAQEESAKARAAQAAMYNGMYGDGGAQEYEEIDTGSQAGYSTGGQRQNDYLKSIGRTSLGVSQQAIKALAPAGRAIAQKLPSNITQGIVSNTNKLVQGFKPYANTISNWLK
jgi:hypothetical protein